MEFARKAPAYARLILGVGSAPTPCFYERNKMKLHWLFTNLLVLTIVIAMLGTAQFALAKVQPPFRCYTCCPNPPTCTPVTCTISCVDSFLAHVTAANVYIKGGKADKAQLQAVVNNLMTWADSEEMSDVFPLIDQGIQAIGLNYFKTIGVDGQNTYNLVKKYGNLITVADFNAMMSGVTQAERENFYNYMVSRGSQQMVWDFAGYVQSIINGMPVQLPGGYFHALIVFGAVMVLVAATGGGAGFALLGGMIALGGSIGVLAGDWQPVRASIQERRLYAPSSSTRIALGSHLPAVNRVYGLAQRKVRLA